MASVASSATYSNTRERSKCDSYLRKLERLDKLAATILDNLKRLAIPGTVIELRVPDLKRIVDGSKYTLTRCYHYDNLQALAKEAARYEGKANIYFTLNAVWEGLVGTGVPADDDYITSRQYIYVDVDPVRWDASGEKVSTEWCTMDAEKTEGFLLMEAVQEHLTEQGWPEPARLDTGNGYGLLYRISLPTEDDGRVSNCLKALKQRFDTKAALVDGSVCNPSRVIKVPGTRTCKKEGPGRSRRNSKILSVPDEWRIVPTELVESLAGEVPRESQRATPVVPGKASLKGDEIIEKAKRAKNGGKFSALWDGNWQDSYESQSQADEALLVMLGFWTNKDPVLMDRLFRRSGLYREKWEREDYRTRSINGAISIVGETYDSGKEEPDQQGVPQESKPSDPDYFTHNGVLCHWTTIKTKIDKEWVSETVADPLANFDARVVEEVVQTTGAIARRVFLIRASRPQPTGGTEHREVEVDAGDFDSLNWVTKQLGAAWSVGSGRTCKDQLREAIQRLSALDGIAQHTCYGHTGWVERDGKAYYLHAGGAIGPDGPAAGFRVELSKLPLYALPAPVEGDALQQAIRACLRILELGRADRPNAPGIAAALVALPWRAVLRPCPFAVSLVGGSGSRKTTTSCLAVQHFAPGHTYETPPPASWAATAAQIEFLQHITKDSLLLLDNFIADGAKADQEQTKAATVLNNQGDGRGRSRMRPDMTPMPELPPRGGVLSTGEDCVQRRSAQGRSLIVKFTPEGEAGQGGSIDLGTLTALQAEAARGLYAQAMAAYVRHVARDRAATLERLNALTAEYKAKAKAAGVQGHARTPGILADLAAGFRLFAEWAVKVNAIDDAAKESLAETHWSWLSSLADDQQEQQDESDDARRFIDLIISALGSGRAYLADAKGKPPEGWAAACGWTWYQSGIDRGCWVIDNHNSVRIGWLDDGRVYLDANEAARLTQAFAAQQNKPLSNPDTVVARLAEKGWLAVEQTGGKTRYKTRKTLEGARRTNLLAFDALVFWPPDGQGRD